MSFSKKIQYRRNSHRGLQHISEPSSGQGKSLPTVKPFSGLMEGTNKAPIQMYREENGYKISNKNQFAVLNEGEPDSKMFATDQVDRASLKEEVVEFNMVNTTAYPSVYGMKEVVAEKKMTSDEIKNIHCGRFSNKATGTLEEVENENAWPGRSLFVKDFQWSEPDGIDEKYPGRGSWDNHYAPVIVQDGEDRGTFETAVYVDHAYFGIYGPKKGQTFRLKTVLADIDLSVKKKFLDPEVAQRLKLGIRNYVNDEPIDIDDDSLLREIEKIEMISKSNPDIDGLFKLREQEKREVAEKKNAFWQLLETGTTEDIWNNIEKEDNFYYSSSLLKEFKGRASKEQRPDLEEKIEVCLKQIGTAIENQFNTSVSNE